MSHQPFETWNLDRENLTPDQRAELENHIKSCPKCLQIHKAWGMVQREIRTAELTSAPSGFAARFQNSLTERRKLEQQRQVRRILTFLLASLAIILAILAVIFIVRTPPAYLIGSAIQMIVQVPFNLRELLYILTFWISRIPISPLAIIAISAVPIIWLMILIITGALTFTRFRHEGETLR